MTSLLGLGIVVPAPGTAASAVVAGLYYLWACFFADDLRRGLFCAGGFILFSVLTLIFGQRAEEVAGEKDPGFCVTDEAAGMFLAFAGPWRYDLLLVVGATFVLFRLLDVTKPWVMGRVESLRGGWGILADDLLAGLTANVALRVVLLLVPRG